MAEKENDPKTPLTFLQKLTAFIIGLTALIVAITAFLNLPLFHREPASASSPERPAVDPACTRPIKDRPFRCR